MKNGAWGLCHALPAVVTCFLLGACAGGLSSSGGGGGGGGGSAGASVSPSGLAFGSETVNATSASQSVTLTSTGSAALGITSIAITGANSGDFAQTNTCGSSLNVGAKCTINVTFTPTAAVSLTANVSITDNAAGSPQTVSLTGTGTSSTTVANITPAFLAFGNLTVNTTSVPQTMTVTNGGTTTFTVNTVTTAAPFAVSGFSPALPAMLAANQSLAFQVTFAPTAAVASNGALTIAYNAASGLANGSVTLSGTGVSGVVGPASAPAIFFTDLVSGPNTGGENGNGTILTIYGARFGATQGTSTVTVGGGLGADYKLWSDTKVAVAIGSKAATGEVLVQALSGTSNGVPFTVRAGNIFCVSTSGSDTANAGTFPNSCWATIVKAKNTIAPGDIAYIMDGVSATVDDNFGAALSVESTGTQVAPKALAGYPGATATIGTDSQNYGLRVPNTSVIADYWVLAGLHFHGLTGIGLGGATGTNGWRIVGNDITCPNGTGAAACAGATHGKNIKFYGNHVHDASASVTGSKLYHAVYWGTESDHIDFGWNEIGPNNSCRGVQFHSTAGNDQFDLHVHDNYIHDTRCDAINFATVDPSLGTVEAYNNVLVHVGTGPDFPEGPADYAGVAVLNATNQGSPCASNCNVNIYNNTIYDAGAQQSAPNGSIVVDPGPNVAVIQNNAIQQLSGERYVGGPNSGLGTFTCDTDVMFGLGAAPATCTNIINQDPLFVNVTGRDFHLLIGSPAVDKAKTPPCPATDKDGVTRPQGAGCDIGAYESH